MRYPDSPVRKAVEALKPCKTPEVHASYQPPSRFGRLMKAESLDPKDVLWFKTCGLCAGLLEIEEDA